ncbi:acetolactate synthase large subunit [Sphingobium fuliginis]|jgi:acetolactate synthase-1/2/3 large subunit|uniref:Acetolactate synthase large subunit n=1 Tax=Sphingobium fuliginis (strain ATCC 27551) TaxID=336203 RepID=A0A7M2GN50_SPHSA|nr:acetolactate synthase large subunit [Sphingobium fuliginis]QOT73933.1 acetolactate synthase large subunit [Sphingobium fuliginis]
MNGADLACDALLGNGVDTWFANPGTSEMHLVAALDRRPQVRCVLGLFEGVVTGAADGYGRMADRPAATLLHCGPGLANGLANLHNARRARTPVVNIVGDHASYHLPYDAPLTSDIESLARPMSHWVGRAGSAETVRMMVDQACRAAAAPGVATLIMPADAAWGEVPPTSTVPPSLAPARARVASDAIDEAARAMRASRNPLVLLGGTALRTDAMAAAAALSRACPVRLLAEYGSARIERGGGRLAIETMPYPVDAAVTALAQFDLIVCIGATDPVAFFAYPGKPGRLAPPGCRTIELTARGEDPGQAIRALADCFDGRKCDLLAAPALPPMPAAGQLTGSAVAAITALLLPDNAIIARESVTQAAEFAQFAAGGAAHDLLSLTGGAIGMGIPLSIGAAVACPDRKVICLQADGSGMYTCQGLWTQAREQLDVVTVILANRTYAVLHNEMRQVGVGAIGRNARRMLDIDDPALNWVSLAQGMGVEGVRVDTTERFADILRTAIARPGPFLIEADISV